MYTNWEAGEPNGGTGEYYGMIYANTGHAWHGQWNDVGWQNYSLPFVLEIPATPVSPGRGESSAQPVIALVHNYPNPFNPSTTFTWSLPHAANISLILYDLLGRDVAIVFSGRCEAGDHLTVFDGSNLASGTYFARLQTGNRMVATRKVVLMK